MENKPTLEEVFKTSGTPTYTFVKPPEYTKLIVAIRTKGRGLVIEGPSGIGKTTCVTKAIEELGLQKNICKLTARKKEDRDIIELLPEMDRFGTVVIDDFHVLPDSIKAILADFMKTLADEEDENSKIILIGINKAGDSLVKFASDLNNRIDTVKFEINPSNKIEELIENGEKALNILFNTKKEIVEISQGSFHIAQMICKESCILSELTEKPSELLDITVSIELVKDKVLTELSRTFYEPARQFSTGSKLRREGRAPYLHILNWLSKSSDWTLQMDDIIASHSDLKGSLSQIVEKGYLEFLISENIEIQKVIHYDSNSKILSIEDPKFLFYISNLLWNKFATRIGYLGIKFDSKYDFALSFAGANRDIAEMITERLLENEIEVFYDKNEQHRILAENVEDYLAPIYNTEALYIIVLLSKDYPKRIWTKFESEQFKDRFGEGSIIPIWYSDLDESAFDTSRKYGGIVFHLDRDLDMEINIIVQTLMKKLSEERKREIF